MSLFGDCVNIIRKKVGHTCANFNSLILKSNYECLNGSKVNLVLCKSILNIWVLVINFLCHLFKEE